MTALQMQRNWSFVDQLLYFRFTGYGDRQIPVSGKPEIRWFWRGRIQAVKDGLIFILLFHSFILCTIFVGINQNRPYGSEGKNTSYC